jgi:hypothetical protein
MGGGLLMEAEYKSVTIKWHDEEDEMATIVAISPDWTENDDDPRVYFYFSSQEEFESAKKDGDNGFEFRIVEEY